MAFTGKEKKSVVRQGLVVVGALALTLVGIVGSAWSANCYDALVGEKYRCKYTYEDGTPYINTCATFFNLDSLKQKFYISWTGYYYYCTCTSKGSFVSPKFNQSNEFLCSGGYSTADSFSGKAIGKKIKGDYFNRDIEMTAVVECTKDPTCP